MTARRVGVAALAVLFVASVASAGDARALAQNIDQHVGKRWAEAKVEPAGPADDAEFLRRVYLDVAGRIPSVEEARTFLDDRRGDRRERLVERLLAGPRYVGHFANLYRALLIPEAGNNFQVRLQQGSFESWLKKQVAKNAGYDQMVRDLLTAPIGAGGLNPAAFLGGGEPNPGTYYLAKEYKPENLAASTARVFLGISVECAQCHHHPFADWKREQFWGFAAFFSGVKSQRLMDFLLPSKEETEKHELAMPGTDKVLQAKFLDGVEPKWKPETSGRAALAEWVTSPSNPYFARAAVNRTWAYFFGTGLVEPVDEMVGGGGKASHPELLDLLAKEFADNKFDLKFLIRAITATKAYQLSSASPSKSKDDLTLFARMPLRGLTAEQLFDSVALATGYRDSGGGDDLFSGLLGGARSARSEFVTKFAPAERPVDAQSSILQALTLMNGKVIADATSMQRSETLTAIAGAPFASAEERVEALYLATLSRKPTAKESARATRFLQGAATPNDALADLFWALLNSPEFVLNH